MAFWGKNFIFDNISSEYHGLRISSDSDTSTWSASGQVELKTETIYRRPVPYIYGVQHTPVLEIPATISTTETEIPAYKANLIEKWLFGQNKYKQLRIIQDDMEEYYFNCFLLNPEIVRIGNIIRGYSFTITCDAPFAWGETITETYLNPTSENNDPTDDFLNGSEFTFYNKSDFQGFTYPTIKVTTLDAGINNSEGSIKLGYFSMLNTSDSSSDYIILNNEKIYGRKTSIGLNYYDSTKAYLTTKQYVLMNSDLQTFSTIDTSGVVANNAELFQTFNKKFFRLVPGYNKLRLNGAIKKLEITYKPAKRIS